MRNNLCCSQLRAVSRITLSPIVETLPCVGGVSVTLLESPYFDACFSLINHYDILALPIIHDGVQFAAKARLEAATPRAVRERISSPPCSRP